MVDAYVERPKIEVNGSEIDEEVYNHLKSAKVEQSVQVPDMFTLRFADPEFEHFDADVFKIGDEVKLSFAVADEEKEITTCEVTALSIEPAEATPGKNGSGGLPELTVTGLGKGHRLARGAKVNTYEDSTDGDIVKKIAGTYSLSVDADATSKSYPYLMQQETDYAFITRRARAIGFEWWVSGKKLYFKKSAKKPSPGPTLEWPDDVLSFKVRFSAAETVKEVQVQGWDPGTQKSFLDREAFEAAWAERG